MKSRRGNPEVVAPSDRGRHSGTTPTVFITPDGLLYNRWWVIRMLPTFFWHYGCSKAEWLIS